MFLNMLNAMAADKDNYDQRVVGRIEPEDNNGIGVSTCYTSDMGYETALLDAENAHQVDRYETKDLAETGHRKWIEFAKSGDGKEVTKLGYPSLEVENKVITLIAVK